MIMFVGIVIRIALKDNVLKEVLITIIMINAQIVSKIVDRLNFCKGIQKLEVNVFMLRFVELINVRIKLN